MFEQSELICGLLCRSVAIEMLADASTLWQVLPDWRTVVAVQSWPVSPRQRTYKYHTSVTEQQMKGKVEAYLADEEVGAVSVDDGVDEV